MATKMLRQLLLLYVIHCTVGQKYEGCTRSSAQDPDLPSLILSRASTPAECIQECLSRYYMYAGLMNGQQCYCGSKFGRNGWSSACTINCATDPANFCGSNEAMSIYSTGQKGPSPPRNLRINPKKPDGLDITWEPPDIPNGDVKSYNLLATVIETYASNVPAPLQSQVQGGFSNSTTLRDLQRGTKYNISITANNAHGTSKPTHRTAWTLIGPPDKPVMPRVIEQTDTTITVNLTGGHSECGPVSSYQVLVVQPGTIPPDTSELYTNYEQAVKQGLGYYITGEFDSSDFPKYKKFVVGDGRRVGSYYNAPLNTRSTIPQIGLAVVSRAQGDAQYAYSDLTNNLVESSQSESSQMDTTAIVLSVAIVLLGALLVASVLIYFMLRRRHERFRMRKLPEQQELTLQGPLYEIDNMGYIPEDVPERVNHYQELKNKVWNIPQNCLTIDSTIIRRGRFGTVHTGTVQKDNKISSVVVHSIADGMLRSSEKRHMLRELDVCIRASSMKYLAGLIGTSETPDTLYVVVELPPQTLKNKLLSARSGEVFPVGHMLPIGSEIASALQHLESQKIVHTHLCARSVGICADWTPKLMGHGIAKYALEDVKYARWTAVECFSNQRKHPTTVVWAFGVLLWEMFSMGGTPYSNLTLESDVEDAVTRGERLPQLLDVPDPLYEVMLSCWQIDPHERPTFDELMRLDTLSVCPITAITEAYIPELELH